MANDSIPHYTAPPHQFPDAHSVLTPLERAAKALYDASRPVRYVRDCTQIDLPPVEVPYAGDGWREWRTLSADQHQAWIDQARAVIAAIREPSEAMGEAANAVEVEGADLHDFVADRVAAPVWSAMIDALLEEGQPTS